MSVSYAGLLRIFDEGQLLCSASDYFLLTLIFKGWQHFDLKSNQLECSAAAWYWQRGK